MIELTRLNGKDLVVNAELIELIERTPDTILTLTTGRKIMVKESVEEVVKKVKEYIKEIKGIKIWTSPPS
jgi:flagellar protein FlbD